MLTVRHLTIRFGKKSAPVVDDLNFTLKKGQCLGLVGESGSGKSLTGLALMQLLPATATVGRDSQVFFEERDLLNVSERQMRRVRGSKIGMIFQDAMTAFNPVFTIGNQLVETIRHAQKYSLKKAKEKALQLLDEVGIVDSARSFDAYPHQLSGGMRQRAMIAMALSGGPEILIADEPTTALDVTIQAKILKLLKNLQKTRDLTLLFISHDLAVVSQLADELLVMKSGKAVEQSTVTDFFQQPASKYSQRLLAAIPSAEPRHQRLLSSNTLLDVKNLRVYFPIKKGFFKKTVDYVRAVDDISFDVKSGETLALVGESGSGKTTCAKAILKLIPSSSESLLLSGSELTQLSQRKLRSMRQDMQIIFQDPYSALNPRMMISHCLLEGLLAQGKVRTKKQGLALIEKALESVDLPKEVLWRYPHEFSGGQRQRICIARALVLEPKLLILDEPTSALDVSIQMQILQLLARLQEEYQLSYLLITHNLSVVAYLAHRMVVLRHGKIVESGQTADLLSAPKHDYTKELIASIPIIHTENQ